MLRIYLVYTKLFSHISALTSRKKIYIYCYQKSENFEIITFLPKIYNNVTKNPKRLSESKKNVSGGKR